MYWTITMMLSRMHCCRPLNFFVRCNRNSSVAQQVSTTRRFVSRDFRPEHQKERGARPLYFQQSPAASTRKNGPKDHIQPESPSSSSVSSSSLPLTPYELFGTASALPPHARHLSPCLGAALAASPLAGNLLRLGQRQPHPLRDKDARYEPQDPMDPKWARLLSRTGFLANHLFFQLIRESPIHMVRNKSMPAVYLTPGIIGCIVGHHQEQRRQQQQEIPRSSPSKNTKERKEKDPNAMLKNQLKRDFGIKSNHIHDTEWTGISLARWMDLVIPWDQDNTGNTVSNDTYGTYQQSLVSALWLIALWGTNPSRDSLHGYYEALERAGIAHNSNQRPLGILDDPSAHAFTEDDFCPKKVEAAMDRLLEYYSSSSHDKTDTTSDSSNDNKDDSDTAIALELVCAAIVLQQQPQEGISSPIVPNGYFNFDGGDTKADCAEVVVREILTLLLWDDTKGIMDVSRLAPTASRKLIAFLHRLNQLTSSEHQDGALEQNGQRELGQVWFDLLSDLPHCDYLAISPNEKAFELAPTSESISKALWHLLAGNYGNNEGPSGDQPWTSLHDLASFWSGEQPSHPLFVKHDRLKHQSSDASSSAGDENPIILEHELISLHLHNKAIEVRLRCDFKKASGMAAVTHLMKPKQERLFDPKQVQKLQEMCLDHHRDPSLVMLCLALQSEHDGHLRFRREGKSSGDSMAAFESLWWLATPYGADRRELKAQIGGDNSSDYNHEILVQSRDLLKERILHACRICKSHPSSGAHLLSWILQESPVVIETSSSLSETSRVNAGRSVDDVIEQALLSLPTSVLDNDSVLEAIEWNWACFHRGRLLTRAIRWKLGRLSLWQVVSLSKIHELVEVVSLSRSIKRRDRTNE